jgi:hypothetical protein
MGPYLVTAYVGDYPLGSQPNWSKWYEDLPTAIAEAFERWKWLCRLRETSVTTDPDTHYCVLVTSGDAVERDEVHFVIGNPDESLL